jgi:hypothetical protein
MARCAYIVAYSPPGCPLKEGEIVYTSCPPEGYCVDAYFGPDSPCAEAWLVLMSCQCLD